MISRRELVSLGSVLAVAGAVVVMFPRQTIRFVARTQQKTVPVAAFVTLSDSAESAAMRSAKTSWQGDVRRVSALKADLSAFDLPEEVFEVVEDPRDISTGGGAASVGFGVPAYPPSSAAASPRRIARPEERRESAFPRTELLNMDVID